MLADADILAHTKVPPQTAARYLGISDDTIRIGLQDGRFPFGTAIMSRGSGKWVYDIRPEALIKYKHHGYMLDVDTLSEMIRGAVTAAVKEVKI